MYGGKPETGSTKFSGPIWPRKNWDAYMERIKILAVDEHCLKTNLEALLQEITVRKVQNNEFT